MSGNLNKEGKENNKRHGKEVYQAASIGHKVRVLLDKSRGALGGLTGGTSIYDWCVYPPESTHQMQEVVYVLEGRGTMRLDDKEIELEPGISIVVPPGVSHTIKCHSKENSVMIFWVQAPINWYKPP